MTILKGLRKVNQFRCNPGDRQVDTEYCESFLLGKGCKLINQCEEYKTSKQERITYLDEREVINEFIK